MMSILNDEAFEILIFLFLNWLSIVVETEAYRNTILSELSSIAQSERKISILNDEVFETNN
jgi:hypothetical protein